MKKAGKYAYLDDPEKEKEGKGGVRAEMAVEEGVTLVGLYWINKGR